METTKKPTVSSTQEVKPAGMAVPGLMMLEGEGYFPDGEENKRLRGSESMMEIGF